MKYKYSRRLTQNSMLKSKSYSKDDLTVLLSNCRVCLKPGELYIFSTENLLEQIVEFGAVAITEDDPFPKYICDSCYSLLSAALLFRKQAKSTEKLLYSKQVTVNTSKDFLNKQPPFSGVEPETVGFREVFKNKTNQSTSECSQSVVNDEVKLTFDQTYKKDAASCSGSERQYLEINYDTDDSSQKLQAHSLKKSRNANFLSSVKYNSDDLSHNIEEVTNLDNLHKLKTSVNRDIDDSSQYIEVTNLHKSPVFSVKCDDDTNQLVSNKERFRDEKQTNIVVSAKEDSSHKEEHYCDICNQNIESINELKAHCENQHNIKITEKVKCGVCAEDVTISTHHIHMKQHKLNYERKKRKVGKVECNICKKFIMRTYIKYHMKMHGTETDIAQRKTFCGICKKSISSPYFVSHLRRIHKLGPNGEKSELNMNSEKLFKNCPVCEKKIHILRYKDHLAEHGKPPKIYVCEHCAKVFTHQSSFKTHQLTHSDIFKYKCQFCPYKAQYLGLIKVHVKTHTGDYNFKCPHCPAKYTTKSNLNQHVQRHNQQGNIKCYECDKYFFRKQNMEKHYLSMHLRVRDVICDTCGIGFAHRDEMLSHQLRVHNRERLMKRIPSYLKVANEKGKNDTEQHNDQLL